MTDPADPVIEERTPRQWPSPVWLVPVLAILISIGLLWQSWASRGPVIEIAFKTATGLTAGETQVKYRDVTVGTVEEVRFSEGLTQVIAVVAMERSVAPYLDADAQFWIVRPRVSAEGITGLETVISGTYIEGSWDTEAGPRRTSFTAQDTPPLTPEGTPGTRIVLRATDGGSLSVGAPVLYKRVEVGTVESKTLTADGAAVEFEVFINAPHDRRLSTATRFWNTSGIDLRFGADGAQVHIESIASLIRGGASFGDIPSIEPKPIQPGHVFRLFASASEAQEQVIADDEGSQSRFVIEFSGSVRGLRPGAPVEYRGIKVGQVLDVTAIIDPDTQRFETQTIVAIQPARLGVQDPDPEVTIRVLTQAVQEGVRAKLAMGNLLTGSLFVNLVDEPTAPYDEIDFDYEPYPRLPSVASDIDELAGSVEGILDRVNALPVEALMANAVALLENANRIVGSDDTRAIPGKALEILDAVERLAASPDLQRSPAELAALLTSVRALVESPELAEAPASVAAILASTRAILDELETGGAAGNINATLAAIRELAESPEFKALPAEAQQGLASLTALINDPGLQAIPERALAVLSAAETVVASPGVQKAPDELAALMTSLRTLADDPDLRTAPARLASALGSAEAMLADLDRDEAAGNLAATIAAVRAIVEDPGTAGLPEQASATLTAIRALAESEDLARTPGEINRTLASVRGLIDDPAMQAVPGDVQAALAALRARLDDPALASAIAGIDPLIAYVRATLERLETQATPALASLRAILDDPGTRATPAEIAATLASARKLMDEEGLRSAVGEAAETLRALRQILDQPSARQAPAELAAALTSARELLTSLEEEDAAGNLSAALASARALLDDPELRRLSAEASGTLAALREVLDAPGAEDLPVAARDAMREAADLMAQFRAENIGAATAGALGGVEDATRAVQQAVKGFPALVSRLARVSEKADELLASVSVGSELNYEAVTAIREIRDAARAVTDLADLVQRQPNVLIIGK